MIKRISKIILLFLIMIIFLTVLLVIVNLIPRKYIEKNVVESIPVFIKEGYYPQIKYAHNYLLDNYTDALMLDTAYSIDSSEPLKSTILMRRNYRSEQNLQLREKQQDEENELPIHFLIENINETNETYFQYSRYWHGYIAYLRPLLIFFNYSQIRIILISVIIILSLILVYLSYKKNNKYLAVATITMLVSSSFWVIGLSLQYTAVYLIALISSIYILIRNKIKDLGCLFLIIGMLTSFFDLLTTPIITLGIPLVFYIFVSEKCDFKEFFEILFFWGIGYGLTWATKWLISDIICDTGTIRSAIESIMHRTSVNDFNVIDIIKSNIFFISEVFLEICLIMILSFSYKKNMVKILKDKKIQQYLILAALPFVWYILVRNHSYIHARFTFRNLMVTILAMAIIIIDNTKTFLNSSEKNKI